MLYLVISNIKAKNQKQKANKKGFKATYKLGEELGSSSDAGFCLLRFRVNLPKLIVRFKDPTKVLLKCENNKKQGVKRKNVQT